MCGRMVDIQSATAENGRGKRNKKKKKEEETTAGKYNGLPYWASITGHLSSALSRRCVSGPLYRGYAYKITFFRVFQCPRAAVDGVDGAACERLFYFTRGYTS